MLSTAPNTDAKSTDMPPDRAALSLMTKLKLDRFKQRKMKFEAEYAQILARQNDSTMSLLDKVQMLSKSIERLYAEEGKERYLTNFNASMAIAKANTSTSNDLLENIDQQLMKVIIGGKKRSEYNYLFGLIMSQWLSEQKDEFTPTEVKTTSESLLTNEQLEKIIFDRPQLDFDQWGHFLNNKLFSFFDNDQRLKYAFDKFKYAIQNYGKSLLMEKVSSDDVRRAIASLINADALDEYRKRLLTKMRSDENAVNEFASSLSLMICDLTDWQWPTEGVRGIFRRNLVGKYRCFYEEDFLTAIFLEHIGLKWSYHFKEELKSLFHALTRKSRNDCSSKSIQDERLEMCQHEYWMASLPDECDSRSGVVNYANMDRLDLKTKLLHLINVEIQLHQVLRPDTSFTVVSTDLEWFGPSIPHEAVLTFLQCCSMPEVWLSFFDRFLKQPVYYKPAGEHIRQRQRGVPISHSLSHLFAELLLFGMDLYVYQTTGIFNYRLHDDFWFFHFDSAKVEQAWTLMNEYAQLSGLKFNEEKCGSVKILPSIKTNATAKMSANAVLPTKDLKWGLLILQSSGRFLIDREALVPFLDEMKIRCANASSILEWVKIHNRYISFFMRNFGKCANILGTYHIEQMTETFQFLHRYVFPETYGNALTVLKNRIVERFPTYSTNEICEAWFYWPLTQGGLGVNNIYLTLHGFQASLLSEKLTTFQQLPAEDVEVYARIVEKYEQAKKHRQEASLKQFIHNDGTLITFDEYIQGRETHLARWERVYTAMLAVTPMLMPAMTNSLQGHIKTIQDKMEDISSYRHKGRNTENGSYNGWLVCYYGGQIESIFNQLDFIDTDNLPIGLIMLMKTTTIDWNKESTDLP